MPSSWDLTDLCYDPDFSEDCGITLYRSTGLFALGGWQNTETPITVYGTITIAGPKALSMVPEGDRVEGSLQLVCAQQVYQTQLDRPGANGAGVSDQILWEGKRYRIQAAKQWNRYGFWMAVLVRMLGA